MYQYYLSSTFIITNNFNKSMRNASTFIVKYFETLKIAFFYFIYFGRMDF